MKILHVISYPRSGSTILGLALGQYEETAFLGEVSAVLTDEWNKPCGCSDHETVMVRDCSMWRPLLNKIQGVLEKHKLWDPHSDGIKTDLRKDFLKEVLRQQKKEKAGPELKATEEILDIIYKEASASQNTPIIVDSSKNPVYFQILKNHFGNQHYAIHLFRDPRAVVYSARRRPVVTSKGTPLTIWRSSRIALGWGAKNLLLEKYIQESKGASYKIRYEEWCQNPKMITDNIMANISGKISKSPFTDPSSFNVSTSHSFHGNRSRKSSGTITIRKDQSWRKGMETKYKFASTIASLLFMKKYGYQPVKQ